MLIGIVHWWPTPTGVESVLVKIGHLDKKTPRFWKKLSRLAVASC
jgi:hypothetical protein